jgi:hypothetical protein
MSGSLREKSPGVWEIRVALGRDPLTGRYRTVSRTVHGGKRKAQEEIAPIVSPAANGKFPTGTAGYRVGEGAIIATGREERRTAVMSADGPRHRRRR